MEIAERKGDSSSTCVSGNNAVYVYTYVHVQDIHKLDAWSPTQKFMILVAKKELQNRSVHYIFPLKSIVLLGESMMKKRLFYIISKYLPTRTTLTTKGKGVTAQWRNLAAITLTK